MHGQTVLAQRSQFDEHRQIDAGNDLDVVRFEVWQRQIGGGATEHVRQHQYALASIEVLQLLPESIARFIGVHVPGQGKRRRGLVEMGVDDPGGVQQSVGQVAVREYQHRDH